jgi:hypothetical protein
MSAESREQLHAPCATGHVGPQWVEWTLVACMVVLAGVASLWRLWEQDIFWQIRAGNELLSTGRFPTEDHWSYTSSGGPWMNTQWLSTVLFSLVYRLGAVSALVVLRGVLSAALIAESYWIVRLCSPVASRRILILTLLPLMYFGCSYRLQLRSDTFVVLLFGALVAVWVSSLRERTKPWVSVGLVWVGANLHFGTATFLLATSVWFVLANVKRKAMLCAALLAAFFCTPYHIKLLGWLWRHLLYGHYNVVPNPDHRPLQLSGFDVRQHGWWMVAWLVLSLAGWLALLCRGRLRFALPAAYHKRAWMAVLLVVLTALSINRERAIPYQLLFMMPLVAAIGSALLHRAQRLSSPLKRAVLPASLAALVWCAMVPLQAAYFPAEWGLGLNERLYPVGAVRFIKQVSPLPNILHQEGEGNYLLQNLREYPVFIDTRESMYGNLQLSYRDMGNQPQLMNELISRYEIQTVLMPVAFLRTPYRTGDPWMDRRSAFFPHDRWALVYFDSQFCVLVRRTAGHTAIISEHEFRLLTPYRSPLDYFDSPLRDSGSDLVFGSEAARCLRWDPGQRECSVALAALLRRTQGEQGTREARALLEASRELHPNYGPMLRELAAIYDAQGDSKRAQQVRGVPERK